MPQKMIVNGVAVRSGLSRNNIRYLPEELEAFSPTLAQRPILKDHHALTDNTIGLVETTSFSNGVVSYEGWIKDDGVAEKIGDKRIKEVSIGAIAERMVIEDEDDPDSALIAIGITGMELSTTPTPGVVGTSIKQYIKSFGEAKTPEEKMRIKPVLENVSLFNDKVMPKVDTKSEKVNIDEVNKVSETNEQDIKLAEQISENSKLKEELAEFKAKEKTAEEEARISEEVEKRLAEKVAKLKEEETPKEDETPAVETPKEEEKPTEETPKKEEEKPAEEPETKGEVADEEPNDAEESVKDYVVERNTTGKLRMYKN